MKFVDEVQVRIEAGDGGNGCVSFRRENIFPMVARMAATAAMVAMSTCWPMKTSTP